MCPEARALLSKLHHTVSVELHLAYRNMSQSENEPHHLDLMPENIEDLMRDSHIVRLSTVVQILDGQPLRICTTVTRFLLTGCSPTVMSSSTQRNSPSMARQERKYLIIGPHWLEWTSTPLHFSRPMTTTFAAH
ncbi:hypothetical protein Aduo_001294 [Ancylostoma duodenale]